MKIYQTDAMLGYRQYAYLLRLDKSEYGYNYLCIGTMNVPDDDGFLKHGYSIAGIVKDLEDFYLEDTNFKITDSELYGTLLFDFFINNYNFEQ